MTYASHSRKTISRSRVRDPILEKMLVPFVEERYRRAVLYYPGASFASTGIYNWPYRCDSTSTYGLVCEQCFGFVYSVLPYRACCASQEAAGYYVLKEDELVNYNNNRYCCIFFF